jgi:hypothetical protein
MEESSSEISGGRSKYPEKKRYDDIVNLFDVEQVDQG